ncbi:hypothetical protein, partial [Streptomyces sp. NPDC096132]|uniref:hypothetical protein n=1 Tax=Streptomyces sp. NPDC096132 TaxID=3366075 RepID=UPI003817B4DD
SAPSKPVGSYHRLTTNPTCRQPMPPPDLTNYRYEPADLEDMTLVEGLDAVLTDLLDHPVTPDSRGLSTMLQHIDLLCHLTARVTGETQYCLFFDHADAADQARAEPFSRAAGHIGRATAHYAQAVAPVPALCRSGAQQTLQKQLDAIDIHDRLRVHRRCRRLPPSGLRPGAEA